MKYIFVVVFAQIVFIITGVLIAFFEKKTCLSKSCKQLVYYIKESLDTSVNPCDDFYQFTCGKVINSNDSTKRGVIKDTVISELQRILLLLKEDPTPGEPEAYAKAKKIFKMCTEDDASEGEKSRRIRELFQEVGGFPIFQGKEWNGIGWTWLETTRKLRERGLYCGSLFIFEAIANPYDHTMSLAVVNPNFPEFETCQNSLKECQTLFNDTFFAAVLGFGVTKEQAEEAAIEIYELEMKLYELLETHETIQFTQIGESSGRDLTNMTASFSYIDWPKLVSIMLQTDEVPSSFELLVLNPGYMKSLQAIFRTTPNKTMANYMMWKVLQISVVELSLYPGNKTKGVCFSFVQNTMGFVLTFWYSEKYPDPRGSDLDPLVRMVDLLKDDMLAAINQADWMTDGVKETSTRKILLLRQRLGDLKVLNKSFVEDFYRGLSVEGDAFQVMLSATKFNTDKQFEYCTNGWSAVFVELANVVVYLPNAFYFGMENSFNVLHGILQNPVFDPGWPGCVNYGRIGSIVGHEITHALDEKGHRYDEHGDLRDTWDKETYERFNKTSQCLADQFDAFYNASESTGAHKSVENMADSGGSRLAYSAYRNYTERRYWPDLVLPGLHYSADQLFFISYALFWCSKEPDRTRVAADPHAPGRYRVLKTLRNNPHFAEVFGCHHGDGMRSGIKCDVW